MPERYQEVAAVVLPRWEVSLAFVRAPKARDLNKKLRGKSYTPNVLSYQVGTRSGEVIICKEVAKEEAATYGHTVSDHTLYLFIHGLLHLKGYPHGATMEKREKTLMRRFATASAYTNATTNSNRHRHRNLPGKNGSRRGAVR